MPLWPAEPARRTWAWMPATSWWRRSRKYPITPPRTAALRAWSWRSTRYCAAMRGATRGGGEGAAEGTDRVAGEDVGGRPQEICGPRRRRRHRPDHERVHVRADDDPGGTAPQGRETEGLPGRDLLRRDHCRQ